MNSNRACSIVVTRVHGMDESRVRFPPGPPDFAKATMGEAGTLSSAG